MAENQDDVAVACLDSVLEDGIGSLTLLDFLAAALDKAVEHVDSPDGFCNGDELDVEDS